MRLSKTGRVENKKSDGITSQKISMLNEAIAFESRVSLYIQIIAKIETIGREAINAPKNELRFTSSDITTIINEDTIILRMEYVIS